MAALVLHHPEVMARHPRAWIPWTAAEDDHLRVAWIAGADVAHLAVSHNARRA